MKTDPFIERHRMTESDWAALRARNFTISKVPPTPRIKHTGINPSLQSAFNEFLLIGDKPKRGYFKELAERHSCPYPSLLQKVHAWRMKRRAEKTPVSVAGVTT